MRHATIPAAIGVAALIAVPAVAQQQPQQQPQGTAQQQQAMDTEGADRAAEVMVGRVYVHDPATPMPVSAIMEKLEELGYTNIHDFDVEWGEYEVEATSPGGQDVEIEIDPITGAILDVEEDFF